MDGRKSSDESKARKLTAHNGRIRGQGDLLDLVYFIGVDDVPDEVRDGNFLPIVVIADPG